MLNELQEIHDDFCQRLRETCLAILKSGQVDLPIQRWPTRRINGEICYSYELRNVRGVILGVAHNPETGTSGYVILSNEGLSICPWIQYEYCACPYDADFIPNWVLREPAPLEEWFYFGPRVSNLLMKHYQAKAA